MRMYYGTESAPTKEKIAATHSQIVQGAKKIATISKDEFLSFASKFEEHKAKKLKKLDHKGFNYEDLPQHTRDLAEGRDPLFPDPHPYLERRLRSQAAGTWVWPIDRHTGPKNEFQQPMNTNEVWVEKIKTSQCEYWDQLGMVQPQMGADRCVETAEAMECILEAMLPIPRQNEEKVGNKVSAMLDLMYDLQFNWDIKPTERMYNAVINACALQGEWRMAYMIEDVMLALKMKPDTTALKKCDEIAQYAWDNGYLYPPTVQGKDINDVFKIDTAGGVGAYVPLPRGESWGHELFDKYEKLKQAGTFKPAAKTPAAKKMGLQ